MTVTDTVWKAAEEGTGLVLRPQLSLPVSKDNDEEADVWSRTRKVWGVWDPHPVSLILCPCPPHEGLRLSGQISISGPSTSHLGMHTLSLLTFWSVTLVRVLLTQGGDCCGDGDFLLLVVCVLITKYLLRSLSGFFLPALPSTFFFSP